MAHAEGPVHLPVIALLERGGPQWPRARFICP